MPTLNKPLEPFKANFTTLQRAFNNDDVCLVACTDRVTGQLVPTLCMVNVIDDEIQLVPVAKMFTGNPYDEVDPPAMNTEALQ